MRCVMQDSLSASIVNSVMLLLGLILAWIVYSLMMLWRRSSSTVVNAAYAEWVGGRDSFIARHAVVVTSRRCRCESQSMAANIQFQAVQFLCLRFCVSMHCLPDASCFLWLLCTR